MDLTQVHEWQNERRNIVAQQREMNDKLYKDGKVDRDFTAEEQAKYDLMTTDALKLTAAINREQALEKVGSDYRKSVDEGVRAALENPSSPMGLRATSEYKKGFWATVRNGMVAPPEFYATLQKAVSTQGGYLVPIEYETKIVTKLYDANVMRQLGTVTRTTSNQAIPMEGNLPTFSWIGELGTYGATDLTAGQVMFNAYKLGGVITISEELLEDAFLDLEDYASGRAGISAGFSEEAAYVAGDGNNKPTGFLTTIAASGTTVTSATAGKVATADLINLKFSVPRPYRKNGTYLVADTLVGQISQEKSTTGQYLWMPSLTANSPDVFNGKPLVTSDFMPAVAASSVSAAFGDFSYYQIIDRVGWSMQKLVELLSLSGQVGFKMWERTDGHLLRPEAIVALQTHA